MKNRIRGPPRGLFTETAKGSILMLPLCAVVAKSADATDLGSGGAPPSQGLRSVRVQLPSTAPLFLF
jgi:hypothetical protein